MAAYDAAFVALAELLDAPLWTLDRRLVAASGPRCVFEVSGARAVTADPPGLGCGDQLTRPVPGPLATTGPLDPRSSSGHRSHRSGEQPSRRTR